MTRLHLPRNLKRQGGFYLLQLSLALIISALIGAYALETQIQTARLQFAVVQGGNMSVLQAAGAKYTAEFYSNLQNNLPIAKNGITLTAGTASGQTLAPTVAQLRSMGYLDASFSLTSSFSNGAAPGSYQVRVLRVPAGCAPVDCDIVGYAFPDQPITAAGSTEPDGPAMSAMLEPLGASGGYSLNVTPEIIIGNGDGWRWDNPLPGNPAGVVVAKFGYGSSGLSQYVRINDDRDPNLQGKLTVTQGITAETLATTPKTAGTACLPGEANTIGTGTGTILICTNNVWTALVERSTLGAACTVDGVVATSTVSGEQLICKNSIYRKSASYMAQNILQSRVTVQDLDIVTKPICAVGFSADRLITLTQISTDVSVAPPYQGMYATTVDLGTTWQVVIRLRTDTGAETSGNTYGLTAVMSVECKLD